MKSSKAVILFLALGLGILSIPIVAKNDTTSAQTEQSLEQGLESESAASVKDEKMGEGTPVLIESDDPEVPITEAFSNFFAAIIGVVYFLVVELTKKITLPPWLTTKRIAGIVAIVISIIGVAIKGYSFLPIGTTGIGIAVIAYNLLVEWLRQSQSQKSV